MDLGVTFETSDNVFEAYVDADHGSDFSNKLRTSSISPWSETHEKEIYERFKSTIGCVVTLYENTIAWICRKQTLLSSSTTKAVFIAVADLAPTIVFLRELTLEIFPSLPPMVTIFEDNLSTTLLFQSALFHGKLKHLALKYLKVK